LYPAEAAGAFRPEASKPQLSERGRVFEIRSSPELPQFFGTPAETSAAVPKRTAAFFPGFGLKLRWTYRAIRNITQLNTITEPTNSAKQYAP
jgi:hypothetical protein